MGRRLVKEKRNREENDGLTLYSKYAKIFIGCGVVWYFFVLWLSLLPQDYEKYNVPLFFGCFILFATVQVVAGIILLILCKKSKKFRSWVNKDFNQYIDKTVKRMMTNRVKNISNYKYIKKCLRKLYDRDVVDRIMESAAIHYFLHEMQCSEASKGEWTHLKNTILPTTAFYKALKEIDPDNAYTHTRSILLGLCETGAKVMNGFLKIPGMKSVFMWMLPKMALKMFGRESGFDYEEPTINKTVLAMNMTECPYCKYTKQLNCTELMPIFCESDFATYGNLNGIIFRRSQTIGTGGNKCDFYFGMVD